MLAFIVLGVIVLSQFFVSLSVYIDSRRTKKIEQRLFSLASLSLTLWTVCVSVLLLVDTVGNSTNITYFTVLNKVAYILSAISLILIYVFSCYYPEKKKLKLFQKIIYIYGAVILLASSFTFIAGKFIVNDDKLEYQAGQYAILLGLLVLFTVVDVYFGETKLLRASKDIRLKNQARTLLGGLSLTLLHAVVFILVLPSFLGQNNTTLFAIGYIAPAYFVLFTGYGLLKQGLFDFRLMVTRTVGYILSLGSMVLISSVVLFVLTDKLVGLGIPKDIQQTINVIIILILAVSYQPLKRIFDKGTNKLFYRDSYDGQQLLDELNQVLVSTIDLKKLLSDTAQILKKHIKAEFIVFAIREGSENKLIFLGNENFKGIDQITKDRLLLFAKERKTIQTDLIEDNQQELKKLLVDNNIDIAARLTTNVQIEGAGYLLLGPKRSGNPYTKQDTDIIDIVANELVIAVQNALQFEEIQKFNVTLQEKIEVATRQLRDTNQKLRELDETKDEFISMASHQLRTPLTSVKGYVSMVLEGDVGKVGEEQKKLLSQAFISSQRMVYLIADLLNVSRLKTGKFIIQWQPTQLADVIEGELSQLYETAKGRKLELTYKKPANFPVVSLDETKIRQVVMNFVDNAIYYTPAGGHIQVNLVDKGESIEFTVVDDGIGVPKEEQKHMFTKFYRAANAQKARPDGTGLGLFMAQKVIVASGGAIVFHSEPGKGSTFGFSFPKAKLEELAKAKPVNSATQSPSNELLKDKKSISDKDKT